MHPFFSASCSLVSSSQTSISLPHLLTCCPGTPFVASLSFRYQLSAASLPRAVVEMVCGPRAAGRRDAASLVGESAAAEE